MRGLGIPEILAGHCRVAMAPGKHRTKNAKLIEKPEEHGKNLGQMAPSQEVADQDSLVNNSPPFGAIYPVPQRPNYWGDFGKHF